MSSSNGNKSNNFIDKETYFPKEDVDKSFYYAFVNVKKWKESKKIQIYVINHFLFI
jgi:hypothetical protein